MKRASSLYTLLLLVEAAVCQPSVIVRTNGSGPDAFYYPTTLDHVVLQQVFNDAVPGDTVYLPGGQFTISSPTGVLLDEPNVVVLGVGIHPDSAQATLFRTVINMPWNNGSPDFVLGQNADGCQLHGLVFTSVGGGGGSVRLGNGGTTDIDDVAFIRCEFQAPLMLSNYGTPTLSEGLTIRNCIVHGSLNVNEASVAVYGSVLSSILYSDGNCSFTNCVFLSPSSLFSSGPNSYQGNIFLKNGGSSNINTPGSFTSNVFVYQSGTVTFTAPAFSTDETITTSPANVFLNAPDWDVFLYTEDYSVNPAFQAAGVNNAMPGIYGGLFPWKEGCIPFNPHWSLLNLTQGTTVNGVLSGVQMKGSAQSY